MMVGNVERGVAGNAGIVGMQVAGKTGTAETGIGDGRTFWFSGFAPANDPPNRSRDCCGRSPS